MSDCAISKIEAGAFVDLVHLRSLDLSDNRLTTLSDGTFSGHHLHQLFLNGNQRLQLDSGRPFANLTVSGLYLHDCRLRRINAGVLEPLIGSLRVLWLSENRLTGLDPVLRRLFASVEHFHLADNRLHCNCELSWLWRVYDERRRRGDTDLQSEDGAECASPPSLRGRHLGELNEDDLRCRAPTLADVEVTLRAEDNSDDRASGRRRRLMLRCTATGDPTPDVRWIKPPTFTGRLPPPGESMTPEEIVYDVGEAMLVLNDDDGVQSTSPESRAFTCVASNVVGNVTLTVRRVLRAWEVADTEDNEVPRYVYSNGGDGVTETSPIDERQLFILRNRFSAEWTAKFEKACGDLLSNSSQSSSGHDLCAGRDRRLRASSPVDQRDAKSSLRSDDVRQYGVKHLVAAVLVTGLLTAAAVVAAAAICLRHCGHSTFSAAASVTRHSRPVTNNAGERTVLVTASVRDTVAYLSSKS